MGANIRRGEIPSELGWLVDILDGYEERLRTLEGPDGGQAAGVLSYLAGLRTYGATDNLLTTGTVANDALYHYFESEAVITLSVPTRKFLVTASTSEASIQPGGSFVIGGVTYKIIDANGVDLPGSYLGGNMGRLYTATRLGLSISTGPQRHEIVDPIANPGPYTITLYCAMWVGASNTTPASTQFTDLSLVAQVIGEGAGA